MAKSRPKLPAAILDLLPEKHGIFRELFEQLLMIALDDRRRLLHRGEILWKIRFNAVSQNCEYVWTRVEEGGLQFNLLEMWTKPLIYRAIRIYERLRPFKHEIEQFSLEVQYYIADHAFEQSWVPLLRQLLDDGQEVTMENFRNNVDPRIGSSPSDGTVGLPEPVKARNPDEGMFEAADSVDDEDDDEPMPWEGNGHSRKAELLDAEPPSRGDENPVETFPAQKPNFGNPFSGNGNGSHTTATHRGRDIEAIRNATIQQANDFISEAVAVVDRFCRTYGQPHINPRNRLAEPEWFKEFDSTTEQARKALDKWRQVPLTK